MKTPKRIEPLVEEGLIDEVLRQLMSGKEATVYVVRCGDDIRCAKVYKEADRRSFHQAVSYQEGRRITSVPPDAARSRDIARPAPRRAPRR